MSKSKSRLTNTDVFAGIKILNKVQDDGSPLDEARLLPLDQIQPNPNQPRKTFNPERDAELIEDIRQRGVLQPIIVRPVEDEPGLYQIVAGERRWRASKEAGKEEIPVVIKEFDDQEAELVSLVENLQRADLDEMDEALFFQKLANDYNLSNREIARMINRSHGYVDNRMKKLQAQADQPAELPKASPAVERRQNNTSTQTPTKLWKYRSQPFQKVRSYLQETIDSWEEVEYDTRARESLQSEIATLKEEIKRIESLLHVKNKTR